MHLFRAVRAARLEEGIRNASVLVALGHGDSKTGSQSCAPTAPLDVCVFGSDNPLHFLPSLQFLLSCPAGLELCLEAHPKARPVPNVWIKPNMCRTEARSTHLGRTVTSSYAVNFLRSILIFKNLW